MARSTGARSSNCTRTRPGSWRRSRIAFEWLEIGGYEQLKRTAARAGDTETAALADRIIAEERAAAEKLRGLLPEAAKLALAAQAS